MGNFVAYIKQEGDGCDYTIACGETLWTLNGENQNDAYQDFKKIIKESYFGEIRIESCQLYEVVGSTEIDMESLYAKLELEKEEETPEFESEYDEIITSMHQSLFHVSDKQAIEIVDSYLRDYPWLLKVHKKKYYYTSAGIQD